MLNLSLLHSIKIKSSWTHKNIELWTIVLSDLSPTNLVLFENHINAVKHGSDAS